MKTALHEVLDLETKNIIESSMFLVKDTKTSETTNNSFTLEDTTLVFGVESEKISSGCTKLLFSVK